MTSEIKVNTIKKASGSTLTLGESGTTVQIACGATTSGMGRTGAVDWCTTAKTSPLTAVNGKGYFVNTTGGAITITLPSSPSAGDIIALKDYANTWDSNNVTIGRNSSKINGICEDAKLDTESQSVTLIYVDGTKGWQSIQDGTSDVSGTSFIQATGGTVSTVCTDYKLHTFTSDANFVVSDAGSPANNKVSYTIVAGGGGSSGDRAGGGGAGGFREAKVPTDPYTDSPLDAGTGITVTAQSYPIVVGAGGATDSSPPFGNGASGGNSSGLGVVSAGGGGGGRQPPGTGVAGGSGGGAGNVSPHGAVAGGSGNTPPVSPPQGNDGGQNGDGVPRYSTGGGGGAGTAGGNATQCTGGSAGNGVSTSISSASVGYAGGGAGANDNPGMQGTPAGPFGGGTAATGNGGTDATNGTANRGGGGGGSAGSTNGGSGGSGVVMIRYKFQ